MAADIFDARHDLPVVSWLANVQGQILVGDFGISIQLERQFRLFAKLGARALANL